MSSDLTSSDKSVDSQAGDSKEDLDSLADSIDASLDAILSEAKEAAPSNGEVQDSASGGETAPTVTPPPAEIQVALPENGASQASLADDMETPLPVIVDDEEPSYKAFADMIASSQGEKSEKDEIAPPAIEPIDPPAAEVSAESAEPESGEILDADELIDSMTPLPTVDDLASVAAARNEEWAAFAPPPPTPTPPTDEELLDHVKLPPGSTPMPMPLVTAPAAAAALDAEEGSAPGSALDDDKTVISPMPPMPEPSVSLPPPRRMASAWATQEPSIQLREDGIGTRLTRSVKSPIQLSVANLVIVVLLASAVGGGVMRLLSGSSKETKVVIAPAKVEAAAEKPAAAPLPAAAVAEKALEKVVPPAAEKEKAVVADKAAEKPAAAPKTAAAKPAKPAAQTHIALANPASKPAPAKKPAAAPAKPKKGAPATAWVDPFGQ